VIVIENGFVGTLFVGGVFEKKLVLGVLGLLTGDVNPREGGIKLLLGICRIVVE